MARVFVTADKTNPDDHGDHYSFSTKLTLYHSCDYFYFCGFIGTDPTRCIQYCSQPLGRKFWVEQGSKVARVAIGGTLTTKIMEGCLVLIPDSDDTKIIMQQCQRQQDQFSEIKR
ncbi:hypothetical protein [Xenorhabdus taiwanensis]|uniref:hypothetical protein n=1 Tax=Xenorhabdus taiwanensis TaxID=3085177 RepID=UPI0035A5A68D